MVSKSPSAWKSLLILGFFSLACMLSIVVIADQLCSSDIERRLPIYPNSEVIKTDYNFLRPRAAGITRMTLVTPDDPETVREWYRWHNLDLLERGEFRGQAMIDWRLEDEPSGEGSLIHLYSECAQS